jgi:hypothetical protein
MTNAEVLKIKTIKAIIEAIDEDDAKQAMKMIKGLLGTEASK